MNTEWTRSTEYKVHHTINVRMHAIDKVFDAVSKTAVISLTVLNVTLKKNQDVQFQLLQHGIKFHTDHFKGVGEN